MRNLPWMVVLGLSVLVLGPAQPRDARAEREVDPGPPGATEFEAQDPVPATEEAAEEPEPPFAEPAPRDPEADIAEPMPVGPGPAPEVWRPPLESPDAFDWIQLDSEEWLRGDIEGIRARKVEFDSKELDDLTIDWDDIAQFRSPRRHTYRFEGRRIYTGTAAMKDGVIRVDTGEEVLEFPRSELVQMIEGELTELNYWSGKLSLGAAVRSGNTDTVDVNVYAKLERETPLTRGLLEYNSSFSSTSGTTTADNQRALGLFDLYMTRRLYLSIPAVEAFSDRFQNIELRLTPGAGFGYDVLENKWVEWDVGALAAYQYTSFDSVQPGQDDVAHDVAAVLRTAVELELTDRIDWDTDFNVQLVVTDFGKTNTHFDTVLSIELVGPLDLDVAFTWDWLNQPATDANGNTPLSNDFRLSVGLGLDF